MLNVFFVSEDELRLRALRTLRLMSARSLAASWAHLQLGVHVIKNRSMNMCVYTQAHARTQQYLCVYVQPTVGPQSGDGGIRSSVFRPVRTPSMVITTHHINREVLPAYTCACVHMHVHGQAYTHVHGC